MLTLHPTERLDIVVEDDLSLRWGAGKSAAAAQPGWRGASCRAPCKMGEESLSQERWCSEWLPLVCSSKIACCVVVMELLKLAVLQGGTDSLVAFAWVLS